MILNKESYGDVKLNYTEMQERKEYKDWLISLIGEIRYKQILKEYKKAFINQYEQSYVTMNAKKNAKVLVKISQSNTICRNTNEVVDYNRRNCKQTNWKNRKRILPY